MQSEQRVEDPSTHELLEDLLSLQSRQTRLLQEIRDLLAAAPNVRRRTADKAPRRPHYD